MPYFGAWHCSHCAGSANSRYWEPRQRAEGNADSSSLYISRIAITKALDEAQGAENGAAALEEVHGWQAT